MLPRSCLRCADSKSNSSTRLPRRTTTRVSSGWVASMSISLAILQSHDGRRAVCSAPHRRRETGASPIIGEWDGSGTTSAAVGVDRTAGERGNVAVPTRSNLGFRWEGFSLEDFSPEDLSPEDLRLEHELQTVAGGSARRCRDFFRLLTASARHCSGSVVRHWHARRARGSGCPLSRGYRRRFARSAVFGAFWRHKSSKHEFESDIRPGSRFSGSHFGGRAGCPNATQPEPVTVSTFFIRP